MAIPYIFIISDDLCVLPEFCVGSKSLSDNVTAIIPGDENVANSINNCGADKIVYCPVTESESLEDYSKAIATTIQTVPNAIILVNNSVRGRLLAAKLSVHLDTAVISGANELCIENDNLACSRMVYGGLAQQKEVFTKPYGVVTIASGIFDIVDPSTSSQTTNVSCISGEPEVAFKRISLNEKKEGTVNLVAAKRIVDVGRGLAAEEDLDMCRKLAKTIDAEIGCSRPVAENNKWLPKSSYMGITGVQVKPDLIITLGLSGQVQHMGGINKSKVIVAINKDKAAPIFKNADFGLVGDMYKIVPALIEKLS